MYSNLRRVLRQQAPNFDFGPDGDVWYAREDVDALRAQGWQPETSEAEDPEEDEEEDDWEHLKDE
jgi:hypothetical protein